MFFSPAGPQAPRSRAASDLLPHGIPSLLHNPWFMAGAHWYLLNERSRKKWTLFKPKVSQTCLPNSFLYSTIEDQIRGKVRGLTKKLICLCCFPSLSTDLYLESSLAQIDSTLSLSRKERCLWGHAIPMNTPVRSAGEGGEEKQVRWFKVYLEK